MSALRDLHHPSEEEVKALLTTILSRQRARSLPSEKMAKALLILLVSQ